MTEFDFSPALQMEQRIDAAEHEAIFERWEFGRWMLVHVNEKGQLPHRFLATLCETTGKSRSELKYRRQFAERYTSKPEVANALATFPSWFAIVNEALPEKASTSDDGGELVAGPLPTGTFRTLVADPPWRYGNTSTRGAAEDHYPTMSIEELCDLTVDGRSVTDCMAEDAHLYLWVTNNFLREGFDVLDGWGFDYKTCLTWVKPQIGMGNYFRSVTEHVLFGTRGNLRTQARDIRNIIEAKRQKHSAKPHNFYELVEKASPGPYLELFARPDDALFSGRKGDWNYWGNEVQGEVSDVA